MVSASATRFPGASGAVAARVLLTASPVKDAASLPASSWIGPVPGFS